MYQRSGFLKISDRLTPKKTKILDFLIAFGLCVLAMSIVFAFIFIAKIPSKNLLEPKIIYGEKTSPTIARLVLTCIDIPIIIVCEYFAIKFNRKNNLFLSLFLAYLAGTFLWQLIGECLWHFGFFRIEAGPAIPFAILMIGLLMYCYKKNAFSWGVLVFVIGFISNWFGHLILIGPAQILNYFLHVEMTTSYIIFGSIFGTAIIAYSIYRYVFNAVERKSRILSTMCIFVGLSIVVFAFLEG